jgi:hypothetical protein
MDIAAPLLQSDELPVEVEYEEGVISRYPIGGMDVTPSGLLFHLGAKHTACLATEKCKGGDTGRGRNGARPARKEAKKRCTEQGASQSTPSGGEHEGPHDREPLSFPSNTQCRRWDLNPHALAGNGF